jgi:hypothetical protein
MIALFTRGNDGRRLCYGWVDKLQHDPKWRDNHDTLYPGNDA